MNEKQLAQEFRNDLKKQLVVLITGAFAFTAALFWNTAIGDTVKRFVPGATSWYWEIIVAMLVTVIAVFAIYLITKIAAKNDGDKKEEGK